MDKGADKKAVDGEVYVGETDDVIDDEFLLKDVGCNR